MTTYSLDLDWAAEDDLDGTEASRQLGLTAETVTASGPAGGWPVVRFTGPRVALVSLLFTYDPDLDPDAMIETVR